MATPLAFAATDYARRQWRVIPLHHVRVAGEYPVCGCYKREECHTPGKHPTIKNWRENASCDVTRVVQWWRAWPNANVGLVMGGESRLVAIDIDGEAGRESLRMLEAANEPLPLTLTQNTGRAEGGEHRLFVVPDEFDMDRIRNRTKMAPGIDVRAEGGLIVAAPSLHPTGARYAWQDPSVPVAPMPSWLVKIATSSKARAVAIDPNAGRPAEEVLVADGFPLERRIALARDSLIKDGEPAIQGQNGSLACLKAACLLVRGWCLYSDSAFELLWHVYNPTCLPPWSQEELMHKLDSAENSVSDESYPWRFKFPVKDASLAGRAVDALFAQCESELGDEIKQLVNATPATNPEPAAGYTNDKPKRNKRNTEGNVA